MASSCNFVSSWYRPICSRSSSTSSLANFFDSSASANSRSSASTRPSCSLVARCADISIPRRNASISNCAVCSALFTAADVSALASSSSRSSRSSLCARVAE